MTSDFSVTAQVEGIRSGVSAAFRLASSVAFNFVLCFVWPCGGVCIILK